MLYILFFAKRPGFLKRKVGLKSKDWIIELGMENCNLCSSRIVTSDLENALAALFFSLRKQSRMP